MTDVNALIFRFVLATIQMLMTGINIWQFVTSQEDRSRPWLRTVFLIFATCNASTGLYLIIDAALIMT